MKTESVKKTKDLIAETTCKLYRLRFQLFLGRKIARHQWLNIKQSMIDAGLDYRDERNLKMVAQIKAGGALTKTNSVIIADVRSTLDHLIYLKSQMADNGIITNSSQKFCTGGLIREMIDRIVKDRLASGTLDKEPQKSTVYSWFHICCPDRSATEKYADTNFYTEDETHAIIIKAHTFINKLKKKGLKQSDHDVIDCQVV